jgi:hypothetical protein
LTWQIARECEANSPYFTHSVATDAFTLPKLVNGYIWNTVSDGVTSSDRLKYLLKFQRNWCSHNGTEKLIKTLKFVFAK